MLFSVIEYSVWEIFPWKLFAVFYGISIILIAFPQLSRWWPFSSFSLLSKLGRWNGIATFCLVTFISIPHFAMTSAPLAAQKKALNSGQYFIVEAVFDGARPEKSVAGVTIPETSLSFDGVQYDVPGSLHGSTTLLPEIRDQLKTGRYYRLSIFENTVLQIEVVG